MYCQLFPWDIQTIHVHCRTGVASKVDVSSVNASYGGQQSYAWTITFVEITGDVGDLVINATNVTDGYITVSERVKVGRMTVYGPSVQTFLTWSILPLDFGREGEIDIRFCFLVAGI